jgi:acyl carrier protein
MDKLVIFEKVQSFLADFHEVDLSEVTVNTKITLDVKTEYRPPIIDKPSFGNLWGRLSLSSSSSGYFYSMEYLDKVEIIQGLEEVFDITISDEEADNIITVQQAVDCISQKLTV